MSPEIYQHLSQRIRNFSEFITTSEAVNFDDSQLWNSLSPKNQQLLSPVRQEFRLHNACLNQVRRWQNHPYQQYLGGAGDTDFEHIIDMVDISHQLEELDLSTFDFDDIELKIIFHDSGEIVTDDMSLVHSLDKDTFITSIKRVEPHCFIRLILNQIKNSSSGTYQAIKASYTDYENKQILDNKESWLVKFIDTIQGNKYGLVHIYNPLVLGHPHLVSIKDPHQIVQSAIKNENRYLSKTVQSSGISDQDRQILFDFLSSYQLLSYGQSDSPYRPDYLDCKFS